MVDMKPQFRLRSIFVAITLLSVCFAVLLLARHHEVFADALRATGAALAVLVCFVGVLILGPTVLLFLIADVLPALLTELFSTGTKPKVKKDSTKQTLESPPHSCDTTRKS